MANYDKALDKAKIGLMTSGSTFILSIAFNLHHIFDNTINTAKTDGETIFYHPDFFISLTPGQRITLIAHEAWHVALLHNFRGVSKDKEKYNRAADYVINQILIDIGYEPITDWLQDNQFRGMSTNEIYDIIPDEPPQNNPMGGDLKDPPNEDKAKAELRRAMADQKVMRAQMQSDMSGDNQGDMPAELKRAIHKMLNPALPWEEILNRFMQDQAKTDYSWRRPNKRFMPDFYMPSLYSERLSHLVFAIDTSGSVTDKDMAKMLTEIQYIKDVMKPERMTILDCDTIIHNIHDVTESDSIAELEFNGGGGTKCAPVLKYCKEHAATALVYFTDLYMSEHPHPISFPLLWIVYNNPKRTKVNIGEITHYDIKGKK